MDQTEDSRDWSKDFVEHLRAVHFALITVSAGLILLVASSNTYRPIEAIAELDQIQKLQLNWDFNTILSAQRAKALNQIFGSTVAQPVTSEPVNFVCDIFNQDGDKFVLEGNRFTCRVVGKWVPLDNGSWVDDYVAKPPDRIFEVKSWWEKHLAPREFLFFLDMFPNGTRLGFGVVNGRQLVSAQRPTQGATLPPELVDFFLWQAPVEPSEQPPPSFRSSTTIDPASVHGFDANLGTFVFAAAVQRVKLNEYSFLPVSAGCDKFEGCFPNLAKASENLQPASLAEMQTYLAQQLVKGDAVFEAFGLKVPVEKLTIWGVVIVLSVQLYLFLQLREVHSKLKYSDTGWNVPWIGIYSSTASKAAFFTTIVVLPFSATVLLVSHTVPPLLQEIRIRWPIHWRPTVEALAYLASVLTSLVLAWLSWKRRPLAFGVSGGAWPATDAAEGKKDESQMLNTDPEPNQDDGALCE